MKYFEMRIIFEVPDDSDMKRFKKLMDGNISQGLVDFISTIKESAQVRFERMKLLQEGK